MTASWRAFRRRWEGAVLDANLRSGIQAYAFGVVGAFLVLVPWSGMYDEVVVWSQVSPVLGDIVAAGWFRGLVSGLGVLDLTVAIRELSRLRAGEAPAPAPAPADRPEER